MRILVDQLADINATHVRVAEELAREHEIVYWIRIEEVVQIEKTKFPGTIFHDYQDAIHGRPATGFDTSIFEPWGSEDILKYARWESETLSMMDKAHANWPINRRKDFYYELLRYWGGVLDQLKPECILFNAPPHQVFNFVLYAIAKERGIPTVLFDEHVLLRRVLGSTDYRVGNEALAEAAQRWGAQESASIDDLPPYMKQHYLKVSGTPEPTPQYLTDFKRETTPLKNFVRRLHAVVPFIKDGSIFERGSRRFFKMLKPNLKKLYERVQRPVDFQAPFVYMPLHYQPECTTSPQGGVYVEQLLMVRTLAAALPDGWEVYVKEHPAQWPGHWGHFTPQRYEEFYDELARIPRVRVVPISTSTFELADRAKATATASGTAAWESILRGKCALVFGYPSFMHAPGIYQTRSVAECRDALAAIETGAAPSTQEILAFLRLYDQVSFRGTISLPSDGQTYGDKEEWQYYFEAIQDALSKIWSTK